MMFEDATGATTSLRQIGAMGPAIFLYVSPSCGSCLHVMDAAPAWQEQLGALPIHYVVTTQPQADVIVERGTHGALLDQDGVYAALWNRQREADAARAALRRVEEEAERVRVAPRAVRAEILVAE